MISTGPECVILAGPNGGGKSSLYRRMAFAGQFINADNVARELHPENPGNASLEAGRVVIRQIDQAFKAESNFVYETTLSSHQSLRVIEQARKLGYRTALMFVALQSADLHIARVHQRVLSGGHHIPEETIRRRYDVSFQNLERAIPLSHLISIFDNSSADGARLVLQIEDGLVIRALDGESDFDQRIGAIAARSLESQIL